MTLGHKMLNCDFLLEGKIEKQPFLDFIKVYIVLTCHCLNILDMKNDSDNLF